MWKPLLSAKSLEQLVERLPVAFNRYYSPCHAHVMDVTNRGFSGELSLVPVPADLVTVPLYPLSTQMFAPSKARPVGSIPTGKV